MMSVGRSLFVVSIVLSVSTVHSCSSHSLRRALMRLDCSAFLYPSACAKEARKIATEREFGTWGAVVVRDSSFVSNRSVFWQFHDVEPYPSKCSVESHNWVIEVFRTGWREQSLEKNQIGQIANLVIEANMDVSAVDLCPISFLRELVKVSPIVDIESHLMFLQDKASKNLGGQWNALLVKFDEGVDASTHFGFDFPHYFYDSRSGFCIKSISNGNKLTLFKIGYTSEGDEELQQGF
uniref:Uncharacterized protein n=1 Tax=Plectus sambesii TaxID=2011161 RepID=A0A914XLU3_9BILA